MHPRQIAESLVSARAGRDRVRILAKTPRADDLALARELKNLCYEIWTTEPAKARKTALALESLARLNPDEEIAALAAWVAGIAALTRGKLEHSAARLDASARLFRRRRREHDAAQTQVAKLIVLSLLGKYDEAVKTGRAALETFEEYGDELAAGKIEMNLSNALARRERHREAEKYCLSALRRFTAIGEKGWQTMAENGLANTYAELLDFRRSEQFYARALDGARAAKMLVTEAEIEASLGNLALFRGRFDEALRCLESSRRKYERLKMPHQSAIAELEIADIYLELNLAGEALAVYEKVSRALRRLKLQGEEARARANFGKAALLAGEPQKARRELGKSARLYVREKNPNGAAGVLLAEAELELARRDYAQALAVSRRAEKLLARGENLRQRLFGRWLRGEILRHLKKYRAAERILRETLAASIESETSNLAQICLNSLGCVALARGERRAAENHFNEAVRLVESLRAPLPAEEFRMAFFAGKLAAFENLARLHLAEKDWGRAFVLTEKARARTLAESVRDAPWASAPPADSDAPGERLEALREQLNFLYSRSRRAEAGEAAELRKKANECEKRIADLMRRRDRL
jgi:tetratricopeptide (TPR) repeat protein